MDERFQTIAHHAHDALAAQSTHGHAQMKRLCRRIPHRTQNLKPLPTTRPRQRAQRVRQTQPRPGPRTRRKTWSASATADGAFMHLASCNLQQTLHSLHIEFGDEGCASTICLSDAESCRKQPPHKTAMDIRQESPRTPHL